MRFLRSLRSRGMRQTMAVAVGLEGFASLEGARERERERR
jgi:hypothetical protein